MKSISRREFIKYITVAIASQALPDNAFAVQYSNYRNYATIPITGQAGAGTDYTIKLEVHAGSGSNAAGVIYLENKCFNFPVDIVPTDTSLNPLAFWYSNDTGDSTTKYFYIKVTDDLDSNQSIYLWFGKYNASDLRSGADTFIEFDDFSVSHWWRYSGNPINEPTDLSATHTTIQTSVTSGSSQANNARKITRTSNGDLHTVYHKTTDGKSNIQYAKSTNGGTSWTETALTASSTYNYQRPAIAVDSSDHLHVVWSGGNASGNQIHYKEWTGSSWGSTSELTNDAYDNLVPSIVVDSSDNIHISYCAKTAGYSSNYQIIAMKRTAGGSWGSAVAVTGLAYNQLFPDIAVDSNDYLHISWYGKYASSTTYDQIRYSKSTDSGATWAATTTITSDSSDCRYASMAIDNSDYIYIAYRPVTNGIYTEIKLAKYISSWALSDINATTNYSQDPPSITIDKLGNLFVVWYGTYADSATYQQIRFTFSADSGTTWGTVENLTSSSSAHQTWPSLMYAKYPDFVDTTFDKAYTLIYSDTTTLKYLAMPANVRSTRSPSVYYYDGTYYMSYYGYYFTEADAEPRVVGVATSSDGKTWTNSTQNPVLYPSRNGTDWDQYHNLVMIMYHTGSEFWGFYLGSSVNGGAISTGKATSPDGETWTKITDGIGGTSKVLAPGGTDEWDEGGVYVNSIVWRADQGESGEYWMYYRGYNAALTVSKIGLAKSTDGITFTKYASNPIMEPDQAWETTYNKIGTMMVWYDASDSKWKALYQGLSYVTGSGNKMGYAESTDGVAWTKSASNPVFSHDDNYAWESYYLDHAPAMPVPIGGDASVGTYHYYNAVNVATGANRLGMLIHDGTGNWTMTAPARSYDVIHDSGWRQYSGDLIRTTFGGSSRLTSSSGNDISSFGTSITSNKAVGAIMYQLTSGKTNRLTLDISSSTAHYAAGFGPSDTLLIEEDSTSRATTAKVVPEDTWIDVFFGRSSNTLYAGYDGTVVSWEDSSPKTAAKAGVKLPASSGYLAAIFVRKYIYPEPVVGTATNYANRKRLIW